MRVVFQKELPGIAKKGEVKDFNDGYARNFLIAKGFAIQATPQLINKIQNEAKQNQEKEKREIEHAERFKADLDKRTFTIKVNVGNKNQIYGSIHEKDVITRIKEKTGRELDKGQIVLPKHLKEVGEHQFEIKLGHGIVAKPKIKLEANQ